MKAWTQPEPSQMRCTVSNIREPLDKTLENLFILFVLSHPYSPTQMSTITPASTEQDVLDYIEAKCPSLTHAYDADVFEGIDGEVFLGLTPATVDMVLPSLSQKDKGLLLARIETLRRLAGMTEGGTRPATPRTISPDRSLDPPRDVTPPPTYVREREEVETLPCATPLPAPTAHVFNTNQLPRILAEVWRASEDGDDEFVAESWLPDLKEMELKTDIFRLALRRPIRLRDSRVMASRTWFGCLVVQGRYHRVDSRLDLLVLEAREMKIASYDFHIYFVKLFTFSNTGTLVPFHTSAKCRVGDASSVAFNEQVALRFGVQTDVLTVSPNTAESNHHGSEGSRTRSLDPNTVARGRSESRTPTPRATTSRSPSLTTNSSVDILISLMQRESRDGTPKSSLGEVHANLLSLYDLLIFANRRELFNLSPRYNRFEAHLLPTHEVNAFAGTEFTLRSGSQIESLRIDSEYTRSHSQVIELLILSWGFGEPDEVANFQGAWHGHTWLLRHTLLSAILVGSPASAKRLIGVAKKLSAMRQIDLNENGFGEVLFTLLGNRDEAQRFWGTPTHGMGRGNRTPHVPALRSSLSHLIQFHQKDGL